MDVIVRAERYDFQVWSNIVNYTSSNAVHVEGVCIHKSHTTKKKDSTSQIGERLIRGKNVHLKYSFHESEDANFFGD